MAHLKLRLLGAFQSTLDDSPLAGIKTDKARALLIYLVVEQGRAHRRQALAGVLWPDYPEEGARANLRHALANLRQVLGEQQNATPFLLVEGETLQLNPQSDFWVDVAEFERLAVGSASQDLESAVSLYRGSFLEGFSLKDSPDFDNWTSILRERDLGMASEALGKLAEGYEQDKKYEKAIGYSRKRLELEPWQEQAHRQLMKLLALSGQRAAALAQYDICRKILLEELGVEPSSETQSLLANIHNGKIAAVETGKPPPHNLPAQLTSFIGREKEIADIKAILYKDSLCRGDSESRPNDNRPHTPSRLVTLTGSGGSGKTRLALQVAEKSLRDFPDGVWFVELASLSNPELVIQTVARTLGLHVEEKKQALLNLQTYLETKRLLLILDNCEHLVKACASLADALLKSCPHLFILSTSREAFEIEGETTYRVPPLTSPDPQSLPLFKDLEDFEAVRLFIERAEAASPIFHLTQQNAPAITHICQRLDGIPLALELAAARVKMLKVEEIAVRLDDRFRLLSGGSRIALPRYQTLRASIDWSYDMLSSAERTLLQRLSVFTGGWVLEAAEAVGCCEGIESCDVLDLLGQLVNKSLVLVTEEAISETRYRMLETIRQYAYEKLVEAGEADNARDRHLMNCVELAERLEHNFHGPNQAVTSDLLERELDNVRLALGWSLGSKNNQDWRFEFGMRLASMLHHFWLFGAREAEGLGWLEQWLDREGGKPLEEQLSSGRALQRAQTLYVAGNLAQRLREDQKALKYLDESRILFMNLGSSGKSGYAWTMLQLGSAEESLALFQEKDDKLGIAECLSSLGEQLMEKQDYLHARAYLEESLALRNEIGDQDGAAWMLFRLGTLAFFQNYYEKNRRLLEESRMIFSGLGNEVALNTIIMNLGFLEWVLGNYEQADRDFTGILNTGRRLANVIWINAGLSFLGQVALSLGNYKQAAARYTENLSFSRKHENSYSIASSLCDLGILFWSVGDYKQAEEKFLESLAMGRNAGLGDSEVYPVFNLGRIAFAQGEHSAASHYLEEALGMKQWPVGSIWDCSYGILEAFVFLEATCQQTERAARLLGATEFWHEKWKKTRTPRERAERETAIAAVRTSLGEPAFSLAWQMGQSMTLQQAIEYARSNPSANSALIDLGT